MKRIKTLSLFVKWLELRNSQKFFNFLGSVNLSKIAQTIQMKYQLYGSCKKCLPSQKCKILLPNNPVENKCIVL